MEHIEIYKKINFYNTYLDNTSFSTQIYYIFNSILECIQKNINELNLNGFLINTQTKKVIKIKNILDIENLNKCLINYNLIINDNFKKINIKLIDAKYGTIDKHLNITSTLSELFLKDRHLHIPKNINLNQYFNDPCYGLPKQLKIKLLVNDEKISITENENYELLDNDIIITDNCYESYLYGSIKIIKAVYGSQDKYIDVKKIIYDNFYKNNEIIISKNVNLNEYFSDPCPNIQKELKIKLLVNNIKKEIVEKEYRSKLMNEIIIQNNSQFNLPDLNLFSEINNLDLSFFLLKNLSFSKEVIKYALNFVNFIKEKGNNINVINLNTENSLFNKLLETKYIQLIQKYLNKFDPIIVLIYNTENNKVIDFLINNGYNYFIRKIKTNNKEYEAAIDMCVCFDCNEIYIDNNTFFSQIVETRIKNKKSLFIDIENLNNEEIIITKSYL